MSDDSYNPLAKSPEQQPYPRRPWGIPASILILILVFGVIQFVAGFIVFFLPQLLGMNSIARDEWLVNSPLSTLLLIIIYQALGTGVLIWFLRHKKASPRDVLALHRPKWIDIAYTIVGWLVYFVAFVAAISVLQVFTGINTQQEQAIGFSPSQGIIGLIMAFIGLVILTPLFEEVFFRGFFYGTLRSRGLSMVWATLITSLIFAALHLMGAVSGGLLWIGFVDTLILSFVLCYVRERSGRLWASIGIHAIKNALAFASIFILSAR